MTVKAEDYRQDCESGGERPAALTGNLTTDVRRLIARFGRDNIGRVIPDESLTYFMLKRQPVRRVLGRRIDQTLSTLDLTNALEIGSGTGELAILVETAGMDPGRIVYSDIDIVRLRNNLPDAIQVRQLDINELATDPNTQSAIISLNTMDLFPTESVSLEQALTAVQIALQPGGHFVHFQDLLPGEFALFLRCADSILLPAFNQGRIDELPFYLLTRSEAEFFEDVLFKLGAVNLGNFWKEYRRLDPIEKVVAHRAANPSVFPIIADNLAKVISTIRDRKSHDLLMRHGIQPDPKKFNPKRNDLAVEFRQYMASVLRQLDYKDVNPFCVTDTFVGPPTECQRPGVCYRYAFNGLETSRDFRLENKVREMATMVVITAQKPF